MASAQVALATITLGSAASTVTFSSIPATYRDLRLVINASGTGGNGLVKVQFNGDTSTSNYFDVGMYGDGSSAGSESHTTLGYIKGGITSLGASETILIDVLDYMATDEHKALLLKRFDVAREQGRHMCDVKGCTACASGLQARRRHAQHTTQRIGFELAFVVSHTRV